MTVYDRACATIRRQQGELARLRRLVVALKHFIRTDPALAARTREERRIRRRVRAALDARRDEAQRARFERAWRRA